ncbi:uncharacterized protein PRCAT00006119001 [Priceomyces carsonii]|uniref:uncharacterized protein n=1 Tax=Priceomyces carsonii TaxID=28549 RepID=UPI002EDAD1CA|nr:unnamed protein product [Priceomyces carsonii]
MLSLSARMYYARQGSIRMPSVFSQMRQIKKWKSSYKSPRDYDPLDLEHLNIKVEKTPENREDTNKADVDALGALVNESLEASDSKKGIDDLLASLKLDEDLVNEESNNEKLSNMTKKHFASSNKEVSTYNKEDTDKGRFTDKPSDKNIVEEERRLFQNIFESYMKPLEQDNSKNQFFKLKDTVKITDRAIEKLVDTNQRNKYDLDSVSSDLKKDLFNKSKAALGPSIDYVGKIDSIDELFGFLRRIFKDWRKEEDKHDIQLLLEENNNNRFTNEIAARSESQPDLPILNAFTLPIIFNKVLHDLSFKFKDGQAALTLFNLLKKDINLYTIVCNQQTYNEILRTQWIYTGKSNLYAIEMTYIEMLNNGFTGDKVTFNILKSIILDYYNLKMANSNLNKVSRLPIWTGEDDKRVRNLEGKLENLARNLTATK